MAERIKSKATINFYICENKEVKSQKSKNVADSSTNKQGIQFLAGLS